MALTVVTNQNPTAWATSMREIETEEVSDAAFERARNELELRLILKRKIQRRNELDAEIGCMLAELEAMR